MLAVLLLGCAGGTPKLCDKVECRTVLDCPGEAPQTCTSSRICEERVCEGVGWICGEVEPGTWSWARAAIPCDDGDACTADDVCSGGSCGGTPLSCDSPPDGCHAASGTCAGGVCSYPLICAASQCVNGVCTSPPPDSGPTCFQLGETCSPNTCCAGLACTGGACCVPVQSACTSVSECCPGRACVNATCCVILGDGCSQDPQCCNYPKHQCALGKCCVLSGNGCSSGPQCCSGTCTMGQCA